MHSSHSCFHQSRHRPGPTLGRHQLDPGKNPLRNAMAPGTQALSSGLFMHLPPPPLHRTPNCTYARNKRPCCPCGLRPQAALAPLVCRALAFYPFLQHCPVIRHSFAERASSCLPLPKPFLSFPMAILPFHGRAGCCTYLHLRPIKHSSYCILLGCIPTLPQMSCKCRLTCKYRALSMHCEFEGCAGAQGGCT